MQRATCTGLRIRSPSDARVIFHAVFLDVLPMVTRRLDSEERSLITPGSVYVWEERGPQAEITGVGIERWTDGIRWGPSRVREGFLFYHAKGDHHSLYSDSAYNLRDTTRSILIKQTYTVFVDTPRGQRKWHLIAYFTEESLEHLQCVDDLPHLASLPVPDGRYKSARSAKGKPEHMFSSEHGGHQRIEYIPYTPKQKTRGSSPRSEHSLSASPTLEKRSSRWNAQRSPSLHGTSLPNSPVRDLDNRQYDHHPRRSSLPFSHRGAENLAPLVYLQAITPPRRYPEDEKTLKLLACAAPM
ncbi:hypothetical protein Moror_16470 [Moniliophthora roreri MCA 2997]|uniref:cAMP-independent regulatory protein pac2 n=2 Tax=Moniliophthora roreri TaxID=221103 RepID=V2YGQ5_MONRO|nr:hypothetical protein Moror_16470 [Moniliophthora roreri MCA 2997]KAI3604612.1 hypothetical protein WG66_008401 [Moniliophthora roreri]